MKHEFKEAMHMHRDKRDMPRADQAKRSLMKAIVASAFATGARADEPRRDYNLVFILADDLAAWGVGSYGGSDARTPRIDSLAAQGARFRNAFATTPICTPSRLSIYTGMESVQIGTANDVSPSAYFTPLPYGVPSWADDLRRAGYNTAFVGKWHLGSAPEHSPTRYGFDYFFGFRQGSAPPRNPRLARGETEPERVEGFTDNLLVDDAIAYMRAARERPFALALNLRGPHLPYTPQPQADMEAVADLDPSPPPIADAGIVGDAIAGSGEQAASFIREQLRAYYASIHNVDFNVGRIVDALDELGLAERTIVIFTSDNGYLLGERGLFNKGAASPVQYDMYPDRRELWVINMWDNSIRVPMIVRWPGVVAPNTELDAAITLNDTYRTVLGCLGLGAPEQRRVGGMDASPLLRGRRIEWRDAVFGQYTSDRIGNTEFLRMVRTDRWKLLKYYLNPMNDKLYDLRSDPGERTNLYESTGVDAESGRTHRQIRDDLERRLRAWQASIDDPALELEAVYRRNQRRALDRWR